MNKKQLLVTSILLSLMLILVLTQQLFKEKFNQILINDNEISKVVDYKLDDKHVVSFPEQWDIEETQSDDDYINYTADFKSQDNNITGTLYVINTDTDLRKFAETDLNNQSLRYLNLKITPFRNKNMIGVLSEYDTSISRGYNFKNTCYYMDIGNKRILKVLFNIKDNQYNDDTKKVLESIISSINADK